MDECINFGVYGSTTSNWLANIELDDIVFISQFNYKSQCIYGPFKVSETMFYDKKIIYPNKKYFYRIKIKLKNSKKIEETDIYLYGINHKKQQISVRLINLIQQNKHLHNINLTEEEGKFILSVVNEFGVKTSNAEESLLINSKTQQVDLNFLKTKNNLAKKSYFSSECDLETYIILSLKTKNQLYKELDQILQQPNNNLNDSIIYNQFVLGNAYPSDLVILNTDNVNIFELKKDQITKVHIGTIKKEIKKYCLYSLHSERLNQTKKRIIFYLICLKSDYKIYKNIYKNFEKIIKTLNANEAKQITLKILEYQIKDKKLFFNTIQHIKN